jgi:rare lipoprotein A
MLSGFGQELEQTAIASFYADNFAGRTTANGEKYQHSKLNSAHKTYHFGTILKVENLENGKEVTVRVNDRGPFVKDSVIDLSKFATIKSGFVTQGNTNGQIFSMGSSEKRRKSHN